jgi:hypothetical protein
MPHSDQNISTRTLEARSVTQPGAAVLNQDWAPLPASCALIRAIFAVVSVGMLVSR